ncbi:hypothetical protein D4R99_05235 [bacterium]|nr:MAG: hypothetical protein D4R99_05235 [bacterium]
MNRTKLKSLLKDYSYSDYKSLHDKYRAWLTPEKVEPSTYFPCHKGEIAVFEFRCNEEISFNNEQRNNDLLVLVEIADGANAIRDYFFDVTCDPKSKVSGIAHTSAQIYRGNVGAHRGDANRPCIRSDYGFGTWYNRTDSAGNVQDLNPSDEFTAVPGHIGINIHNANGNYNSSLGCTMFDSEGAYQKIFRSIITACRNKANIMVALIDAPDFCDITGIKEDAEEKEADNANT